MPAPVFDVGVNCMTEYEDRLKQAVASCDSFTAFACIDDDIDPLDRVFIYGFTDPKHGLEYSPDEWIELHPSCTLVHPEDGQSFEMVHDASANGFRAGFAYELIFEKLPERGGLNISQEVRKLVNSVGSVIEEMQSTTRAVGVGLDRIYPIARPDAYRFKIAESDYDYMLAWRWRIEYRLS